jgi:hypothetical protein
LHPAVLRQRIISKFLPIHLLTVKLSFCRHLRLRGTKQVEAIQGKRMKFVILRDKINTGIFIRHTGFSDREEMHAQVIGCSVCRITGKILCPDTANRKSPY